MCLGWLKSLLYSWHLMSAWESALFISTHQEAIPTCFLHASGYWKTEAPKLILWIPPSFSTVALQCSRWHLCISKTGEGDPFLDRHKILLGLSALRCPFGPLQILNWTFTLMNISIWQTVTAFATKSTMYITALQYSTANAIIYPIQ